ncbi:MAG: SMP-30/gluconolactonase/LRE family protein [Pseudomonadota bacterium]|jgi:sugar lactone lactonase YvrE|nr:SMP-30/gluconolactonase/LRE family protein [Pseudomonadota bacterium]
MKTVVKVALISIAVAVAYLLLWPVAISPKAWDAPLSKGFTGSFAPNTQLSSLTLIDMENDYGPEDFAVNSNGDIATSSHSGFILVKKRGQQGFTRWVSTQGRPLGIEYDHADNLIVADAEKGLLKILPTGDIETLVTHVAGQAVVYADDVDIADDGTIYFTDATAKFAPEEYNGTLNASMLEIFEHMGNGKVIAYYPDSGKAQVLMDNLVFANGITLSHDNSALLVNETGKYRVLRYDLNPEVAEKVTTVINNLPGFPDNIVAAHNGYLIGLASPRSGAVDALSAYPFIRSMVQRLPSFMRPSAKNYGHLIRINEKGKVLNSYQDPAGLYPFITGALEVDEGLYISSLTAEKVGFIKI